MKKWGWIIVKKGRAVKTDGVELSTGHIADIQTSYKYSGSSRQDEIQIKELPWQDKTLHGRYH